MPQAPIADRDADRRKERSEWFYRGRVVRGVPTAELRRRAIQAKMQLRAQRAAEFVIQPSASAPVSFSLGSWIPLGPRPLASDASGNGTQDYRQVAGRATAVVIDPADASGNTVYVGGAQAGIWKSTNAASTPASNVTWAPVSDDQATLSIGAIAIQLGNVDPTKSVILAATGEANNSGDSYFGLGILRSADAGKTWALIRTANAGALSFSGLGGTRMAFSTTNPNVVVAAMATSSEGLADGAVTVGTTRGLYTSQDAGQSWSYNALTDSGITTDATSATSVVYSSAAKMFFGTVRFHGFYSSTDGVNWTRLVNQPGGVALGVTACPPQSTSNNRACPIYRGEISVVPGRNEMYAWYVSFAADGSIVDGGIWQSTNAGASWNAMSDSGNTNCGDFAGCGVEQGDYNLELLSIPNGSSGTDLYAGAVNLYKCSINSQNPTCAASPFINLTHVYGCDPVAAPAHVHPDQHAMAFVMPTSGSDSGNALLYFANDGGVYRALDGYSGLTSGACSGTNAFDDLNQNLGSMTQFVSFSQHPTDPKTLLGGTQDNGSPATSQATTNLGWGNVLGGDGGYNAIDPTATSNWYASNPDIAPGGLNIQLCTGGANCNDSGFSSVVTSSNVGGDDGAFYFPYILDSGSTTSMLVGTCRVWRGPRTGGAFTALSPNFETLGSGSCSGDEVNQVRAIAAGGITDTDGSSVVYATTSGLGPIDGPLSTPPGGHVWVTTSASSGPANFVDVTGNGPQGSINPNQFPISGVATDSSDRTGNTAYVTVMGFTGGAGHVWKTTNAGATWIDFTGNLPDSPVNAVVVYPPMSQVFVATDVGVFGSSISSPNWVELGPIPTSGTAGFLPNVAATALGVFASGGQQLLRASTYGRGIWQFNLVITPDFQMSVANSPQTLFTGQTATFNGTITAVNGYSSSVTLSCVAGSTPPPSTCTLSPVTLIPTNATPFTLTAGGSAGDYSFNLKAVGSDTNHVTHTLPITLHLVSFGLTAPSPTSVTVGRGGTSAPVSFQVTAAGSFNQSVNVTCNPGISGATCNLTPSGSVNPTSTKPVNMTATVSVPAGTALGSYMVTIQATTAGAPSPLTTSFTLNVTGNPDFALSEPSGFPEVNAGSAGVNGPISITTQDGFAGTVTLSCSTPAGAGSCSLSPSSASSFPATATLTINGSSFTAGNYSATVTAISGLVTHTLAVPFSVGDYSISGTQNVSGQAGAQATATFTLTSSFSYSGRINATCDATALPAATCTLSPSGAFTLASGGTANLGVTVSVPNNAVPGSYGIKINTQDTTGAPIHSASFAITMAQDFVVTTATPSQTVQAGQTSGAYALSVQPLGSSFTGPVSLACTAGLPAQAQCMFNPSGPVTPGTSAVDVTLNIATKASGSAASKRAALFLSMCLLPAVVLAWRGSERGRRRKVGTAFVFCALVFSMACAGTSSGGGTITPPPPVTYHVTVTGSSPGTPADSGQSVIVTLVVD